MLIDLEISEFVLIRWYCVRVRKCLHFIGLEANLSNAEALEAPWERVAGVGGVKVSAFRNGHKSLKWRADVL